MRELQEFDKTPLTQVREFVVDQLKLNFAHDNLEVEEFEIRLEKANQSASKQEMLELVSDLPRMKETESKEVAEYQGSVAINTGRVKETANMVAILGGSSKKGVWKPARSTRVLAVLGGTELDYTEAIMPPGTTDINVACFMGGVDIAVPPGVNVVIDVIPILGGADDSTDQDEYADGPTLRVRGVVLFGGVEVKTKYPKKKRKR
jgi:hypothetical protein